MVLAALQRYRSCELRDEEIGPTAESMQGLLEFFPGTVHHGAYLSAGTFLSFKEKVEQSQIEVHFLSRFVRSSYGDDMVSSAFRRPGSIGANDFSDGGRPLDLVKFFTELERTGQFV